MDFQLLDTIIKNKKNIFQNVSNSIWGFAEMRFQEYKSSELQCETLKQEGFDVEEGIGGIPSAFKAKFGKGCPVIAFLGEYDALSQLSQKADIMHKEPVVPDAPGHGCGHQLLGAGCMQAAVAVKDYLLENPAGGTVVYYGCPGEEGGAGKAFMVREGCFEECDICFAWHPYAATFGSVSTLANARIEYHFTGKASHAATTPHLGRSALDAVELMNVGANFLREHMIPEARVHYAITNTGGDAPNVVQAESTVLYSIRAPRINQVYELVERVNDIAKGAALMTGTSVDIKIGSAYADVLQNKTLDNLVFKHMQQVFPLAYTKEELEYAEKFKEVGDPKEWIMYQNLAAKILGEKGASLFKGAMADFCMPPMPMKAGSSDVGDVSWNVPSSWFGVACFALGTSAHSWQAVAQGKSAIAHRGMTAAATIMARAALEIIENPQIVQTAKADMEKAKNGEEYCTLIPNETKFGSF